MFDFFASNGSIWEIVTYERFGRIYWLTLRGQYSSAPKKGTPGSPKCCFPCTKLHGAKCLKKQHIHRHDNLISHKDKGTLFFSLCVLRSPICLHPKQNKLIGVHVTRQTCFIFIRLNYFRFTLISDKNIGYFTWGRMQIMMIWRRIRLRKSKHTFYVQ